MKVTIRYKRNGFVRVIPDAWAVTGYGAHVVIDSPEGFTCVDYVNAAIEVVQ